MFKVAYAGKIIINKFISYSIVFTFESTWKSQKSMLNIYLSPHNNCNLFVAVTKTFNISTKTVSNETLNKIKLEPDNFHDSMIDI